LLSFELVGKRVLDRCEDLSPDRRSGFAPSRREAKHVATDGSGEYFPSNEDGGDTRSCLSSGKEDAYRMTLSAVLMD
jgi:hypothetical protein